MTHLYIIGSVGPHNRNGAKHASKIVEELHQSTIDNVMEIGQLEKELRVERGFGTEQENPYSAAAEVEVYPRA